jgi:hypothetical protein
MKIVCIGVNEKLPKDYQYINSWEVEELICKDFKAFEDLELSVDVGYYKIKNKGDVRYLWLARLGNYSQVDGYGRLLYSYDRVRGVLIWKK